MVDEGRLGRLLRGVSERVDRLRAARRIATAERGDLWLDGVKYLLITTIEGCLDAAQHVISSENLGVPDSNADAVRMLGARGVIEEPLAASLARSVGFRNVLVHQYARVDDDIVVASLDRLHEFDEFVSQVSAWLLEQD